ncbi:MAG: hypothetical protein KGH61_04585 [Candidatus Micrarchaeota archaeon]|nr:hypothetical protein [Candidatus Micrarchaeota archaeon]MDE1848194.1 hypothetical protein [Candidatus Micrarchaeota archaeon]MDE1864842.1 hypothetical protein [Candidatus Micrarchaeota archaeon]
MMKIKADQELKSMEEKIKMLSGNYMNLKSNVERLENHLNKIKTHNAIISQTPNNPRKHIDLHAQNAEYYHLLEMPESRKQEYFYSATSAATEMKSISEDLETMLVAQKLSWQTVAMGGIAGFASSSQLGLDKLNDLIDTGKLMLNALECGRISPKELTREMVVPLKLTYKASYGLAVYNFRLENKVDAIPGNQKSVGYLLNAMSFDAYSSLNERSFVEVYNDIKSAIGIYSGAYDALISDIENRREFFDIHVNTFLSKLRDNATLKSTTIDAHRP